VAYVDWSAQEIGIAAALSGDSALIAAYQSGDPYMRFAVESGLAPPGSSKRSHPELREQIKMLFLAMGYGMTEWGLANRLRCQGAKAPELLALHRRTFPRFWAWSDAIPTAAHRLGGLRSVFGWPLRATPEISHRTLLDFPAQANGAEMMRIACCLG